MKRFFLVALLSGGMAMTLHAQEFHMPKPSPTTSVKQNFSTSFIQLDYSRPSMRGRQIFGHVVPYGVTWRTGANAATTITFGEPVYVAGRLVKAGKYALYTIPHKKNWTIILNTGTKNWGTSGFTKKDDILQLEVKPGSVSDLQQTFSISVEDMTDTTCNIVLRWAHTKVSFPVKADNNARIMAHLDKALQGKNPPYGKAASYYYTTNQKLELATKYAALAIKKRPKAYYLHWLKARIYQKRGMHTEAVAEAKLAMEGAKGQPKAFRKEYKQHYEDMLNAK